MRRLLSLFASGLLAFTFLMSGSIAAVPTAAAATIAPTTTCANGVDNTPGLSVICEVTIVNTITPTGGSATVTVRECHGAAGDPEAACETFNLTLNEPVTAVDQCNGTTNGGGGELFCSVELTNNYVVDPASSAVTVNQCVGSGGGITTGCDPFPATTTNATITQCNGSANGGTLVGLTCTATGTESDGLAVTITQCNDSTNGGGAEVICSANIESNLIAPTPTPTPTPGAPGPTPTITQPPTDTIASATDQGPRQSGSSWAAVLAIGLFVAGFAVMTLRVRPRSAR